MAIYEMKQLILDAFKLYNVSPIILG